MIEEKKKRRFRHLKNAPIIEALLDIQVQASPDISPKDFIEKLKEKVGSEYPNSEEIRALQGMFSLSPKGSHSQVNDLGSIGYMFRNESKTRALQFKKNGFTFSQLKPYESWKSLLQNSQHWWGIYDQIISEKKITRIALRYINRLELPGTIKDIPNYLPFAPKVPLKGDFPITEFLERVVFQNAQTGAKCIFTQALEPTTKDDFLSIIIDIDAFYEVGSATESFDLWEKLIELREFKNEVFYRGVSKRAWERYL